ncbi:MAG: hypothetical protein QOE46_1298 [Acidobacteriota bacterium]|jgi:uncharacterized protein YecE (DUF72 family)|nr:hypothetical protein [Acidobacteriota bacterium]
MPDCQKDSQPRPRVQVGCQGWNYDDWVTPPASERPIFYPRSTRPEHMLEIYARAFETVEVDSTFYAAASDSTYEGWAGRTPDGFTFALKLPREITHEESLRGERAARALSEFCRGARRLGSKLAAVLVQLPPQFEATRENLRALSEFLPLLPPDIRFAVEFRDPFWFEDELLVPLSLHRHVSLALVEAPWVTRERVWRAAATLLDTSDFVYVRWMGARDLTRFDEVQRPRDANLERWAAAIERLRERVPAVSTYFSNFYEGHAPASANKLKRLLGQPTTGPEELENQPSLF